MSITSAVIDWHPWLRDSESSRWKVKDAASMAPCFCLQGGRGWHVLNSGQSEGIQTQDSWVLLESFPLLGCKAMTNLDSILKSREITNKGPSSQSYGFSRSHVWIWELDCKESWVPKNWCFWAVVLDKTPESPLGYKEIKPVNSKGNQSWIFIGRTDAEVETPILWPPDVKNWLIGKDPDAGKDWKQKEKGTAEVEIVGWHHWLDGCE